MDHYCEVCDKHIKPKTKYKHFKSNFHKEFHDCEHIMLSSKDIDINKADGTLYLYIVVKKTSIIILWKVNIN